MHDNVQPCIPIPPLSVPEVTMTEVTYSTQRMSDHMWHRHVALYDGDELVRDHCTLAVQHLLDTRPPKEQQ